jgi:choline kinase
MAKSFSGIILAAGMGTRLGELSQGKGKALFHVAGRPLISYAIDFMRELGCSRIFVVGGYMFPRLRELLKNETVELRHNQNYEGKGNIFSLLQALPEMQDSFVMMNVDHVYNRALAPVIRSQFHGITAFCDFDRPLGADDMKVLLNSNFKFQISNFNPQSEIRNLKLVKMSKQLTDYHCGYVGMTYVDERELTKYKQAATEVLAARGDQAVVENILAHLAEQEEHIRIGDISGYGWLEIDTPEEFYKAERAILENQQKFLIPNF